MAYHPQASKNPFGPTMEMYAAFRQDTVPFDMRTGHRPTFIEPSPHGKEKLNKALLDIQQACQQTIKHLRTKENIIQLQERVFVPMKRYEEQANQCMVRARNPVQADYCIDEFHKQLTVEFRPTLKKILSEF